jgi:hypothetical protein
LQGGELRLAKILRDVHGATVDKLLDTKAGGGFGERLRRDDVLTSYTDGHDTTLLMITTLAWLTFVYLLDDGRERKSSLLKTLVLPQRWYIGVRGFVGCVDNRTLTVFR